MIRMAVRLQQIAQEARESPKRAALAGASGPGQEQIVVYKQAAAGAQILSALAKGCFAGRAIAEGEGQRRGGGSA